MFKLYFQDCVVVFFLLLLLSFHVTVDNKERIVRFRIYTQQQNPWVKPFCLLPERIYTCNIYCSTWTTSQTRDTHSCFIQHALPSWITLWDACSPHWRCFHSPRPLSATLLGSRRNWRRHFIDAHGLFQGHTLQSWTEACAGVSRRPSASQWIRRALGGESVHVSRLPPPPPNPHFYLFSSLFGLTGVVSVLSSCFTRRLCSNWLLISV